MTGAAAEQLKAGLADARSAGPISANRGRSPHLCLECGDRHARFSYRGRVKADHQHTLCFECYRACMNRLRVAAWDGRPSAVPTTPQRARDIADRAAFAAELTRRRRRAILNARLCVEGRAPAAPALRVSA